MNNFFEILFMNNYSFNYFLKINHLINQMNKLFVIHLVYSNKNYSLTSLKFKNK